MQYENNLRKNVFYREREKKQDLVFKKPFSKRYIWKKGGRLIIRVVLYSGQYGTTKYNVTSYGVWECSKRV